MEMALPEVGPFDETEPVPPQGCGSCLQDNGEKKMVWKFVGEGQGTFQPVQNYEFVGNGRGTHEKEVVVKPGRINLQKVCLCVVLPCALALLALVLLLGPKLRGRAGGGPRPEEGRRVVVEASHKSKPRSKGAPVSKAGPEMAYDCNAGFDNWAADWNVAKKDWCCTNQAKGCAPEIQGCDTLCEFAGHTASCAFRVQWGANHRFLHQFNACAQAFTMVQGQCPYCSSCQLSATGCQALP